MFPAEETEAPEGTGLEGEHMVAVGEAMVKGALENEKGSRPQQREAVWTHGSLERGYL